jgi:hypothetical protein
MGSIARDTLYWRESTPGVYTRSLDATESHFVGMRQQYSRHDKEWARVSTVMKIDFLTPDFVGAVLHAWKWIRYRHPILASTVSTSNTRVYMVPTPSDIKDWIMETFIVHSGDQSAQDFLLEVESVERATLHVFPHTQQLIFVVSHHTIDGESLLLVINYLLEILNSPPGDVTYGDEMKNLPRPLRLAAHIPDADESHAEKNQSTLNNWFSAYPSLGVGAKDIHEPPGTTRSQGLELSVEESTKVIAAAKAKGFSPTYVIEAAAIMAAMDVDPLGSGRNFCTCGLFSLRGQCDVADQDACMAYVTFIPRVTTPGTFLETAQQLKDYYNHWKGDEDLLPMIGPMLSSFAVMKAMPDLPPNDMVSISSLGRLEPRLESVHGKVALGDLMIIYESPDPGVTSCSWTRRGQITWRACYNERYHEEGNIASWVVLTKKHLLQGLEID